MSAQTTGTPRSLRTLLLTFGFSAWAAILAPVPSFAGADSIAVEPHPVYPNAESVRPLAVGADVPSAMVRTIEGAGVDVATLMRDRGALLVFYRGGW